MDFKNRINEIKDSCTSEEEFRSRVIALSKEVMDETNEREFVKEACNFSNGGWSSIRRCALIAAIGSELTIMSYTRHNIMLYRILQFTPVERREYVLRIVIDKGWNGNVVKLCKFLLEDGALDKRTFIEIINIIRDIYNLDIQLLRTRLKEGSIERKRLDELYQEEV